MKIEGNRPEETARTDQAPQAQQAQQAERVQAARIGRDPQVRAGGDRVELSTDAQLMSTALREVARTPPVRQDVVERVRQKLAAGEVGQDPLRLADRIIDSLLR